MPRGGKRTPGPGKTMGPDRKPEGEKYIKFALSLPPHMYQWLISQPDGKSQTIQRLIENKLINDAPFPPTAKH